VLAVKINFSLFFFCFPNFFFWATPCYANIKIKTAWPSPKSLLSDIFAFWMRKLWKLKHVRTPESIQSHIVIVRNGSISGSRAVLILPNDLAKCYSDCKCWDASPSPRTTATSDAYRCPTLRNVGNSVNANLGRTAQDGQTSIAGSKFMKFNKWPWVTGVAIDLDYRRYHNMATCSHLECYLYTCATMSAVG
jgi:hypothetical protein